MIFFCQLKDIWGLTNKIKESCNFFFSEKEKSFGFTLSWKRIAHLKFLAKKHTILGNFLKTQLLVLCRIPPINHDLITKSTNRKNSKLLVMKGYTFYGNILKKIINCCFGKKIMVNWSTFFSLQNNNLKQNIQAGVIQNINCEVVIIPFPKCTTKIVS